MNRFIILFLLLGCCIGCEPAVVEQPQMAASPPSADLDLQYSQLIQKRLYLQERIEKAMRLYAEYAQKTHLQKEKLKSALGKVPYAEAVKQFADKSPDKPQKIPANLHVAASYWRLLLPDEIVRLKIQDWMDKQMETDLLGELEIKMKTVENYRKVGNLLGESDQKEIDRLLATPINDWESSNADDFYYEQKVLESLETK